MGLIIFTISVAELSKDSSLRNDDLLIHLAERKGFEPLCRFTPTI